MTAEEILSIIKEKHYYATIDYNMHETCKDCHKKYELKGMIDAYYDLECLIKSKLGKQKEEPDFALINDETHEVIEYGKYNDLWEKALDMLKGEKRLSLCIQNTEDRATYWRGDNFDE